MKRLPAVLAVLLALFAAVPVSAASERDAVFQRLLATPEDRALMLQYARLCVEARDYETAVATLERLVDLEPDSVDARYQLALAYFALGSDDVARYHLGILQRSGALSGDDLFRVMSYEAAIDRRSARNTFSGFTELGVARLTEQGVNRFTGSFSLTHRIDLGGPNKPEWVTRLRADVQGDAGNAVQQRKAFLLATGPTFRITGDRYGATLHPYLAFQRSRGNEVEVDRDQLGLGLAYENPLSAQWSVFAGVEGGRLRFNGPDVSGNYREGRIGVEWRPAANTGIRASVFGRRVTADVGYLSSDFRAARIDISQRIRPGGRSGDWLLSAHAQKGQEEFDYGRTDDIVQYGAAVKYFVLPEVYVETGADRYDRDSNFFGYDRVETTVSLKLGVEF